MTRHHRHLDVAVTQRRSHFHADKAVANNYQLLAFIDFLQQVISLLQRAQQVHTSQIAARQIRTLRRTAGSDEQLVVKQRFAVGEMEPLFARIQPLDLALYTVNVLQNILFQNARHVFDIHLAGGYKLGQRRAVVSRIWLPLDQHDFAFKTVTTQRPDGGAARCASAEHRIDRCVATAADGRRRGHCFWIYQPHWSLSGSVREIINL